MQIGFKIVLVANAALALCLPAGADEYLSRAITNKTERLSYSVGISVAAQIKRVGFEVDPDVVGEAIKDVLNGRKPKLTEEEAQKTMMEFAQEQRAKREEARLKLAEKNHAAGEAFLAQNKKKPGVMVDEMQIPGGPSAEWQYRVVTAGTGATPKTGDTVTFKMRGTLIDGTEFARRSEEPVKTAMTHFYPKGLNEAVQRMKAGSKWEIFLPASLAFGDFGNPPNVEPGATVIYEVELLNVETPEPLVSDVIEVPSAEQMKAGKQIRVIKADELKSLQSSNAAPAKP